jgi:hypothetical protein
VRGRAAVGGRRSLIDHLVGRGDSLPLLRGCDSSTSTE